MGSAIALTKDVFLPFMAGLTNENRGDSSSFIKREIVSRVAATGTIFFRTADTLLNFGVGVARVTGRLLFEAGIKQIDAKSVSNEAIRCSFKASKNGILKDPLLFVRLLVNPVVAPSPENSDTSHLPRIFHQAVATQQLETHACEELDKNWNLNAFFGHVYVINLDDNPEGKDPTKFKRRLDNLSCDVRKIGDCKFERFRATYGANELPENVWNRVDDNSWNRTGQELDRQHMGQAGCYMSHYRVIKDAYANHQAAQKELAEAEALYTQATSPTEQEQALAAKKSAEAKIKEYSSILILEDDNGFGFVKKVDKETPACVEMEGAGVMFRKVMQELPEKWDMLYLLTMDLGTLNLPLRGKSHSYSENLNRLGFGLLTNAVAINSKAYSYILQHLSKIDKEHELFKPVDHAYAHLQQSLNTYTPKQPVAYQAPGESSITTGGQEEPWNGTWDRGF